MQAVYNSLFNEVYTSFKDVKIPSFQLQGALKVQKKDPRDQVHAQNSNVKRIVRELSIEYMQRLYKLLRQMQQKSVNETMIDIFQKTLCFVRLEVLETDTEEDTGEADLTLTKMIEIVQTKAQKLIKQTATKNKSTVQILSQY